MMEEGFVSGCGLKEIKTRIKVRVTRRRETRNG